MRARELVILAVGIAAMISTDASAAKLFGDLAKDGKPLPGVRVFVTRPGSSAVADSATTDKSGSYRLLVKEQGKCMITVVFDGTPVKFVVFSNEQATRYDFVIVKQDDGQWVLRRK